MAGAVNDAAVDIPAELVGAEDVSGLGAGEGVEGVDGVRVLSGEEAGSDGGQSQQCDERPGQGVPDAAEPESIRFPV